MKLSSSVSLALRVGAGFAAIGLMIYFGRINLAALSGTLARPGLLALSAFLLLALVPLAAFRWWLLLAQLGIKVNLLWALRTNLITAFLGTFLPGAFGGDVARVALAYRAAGGGLSRVTFSVLVDRVTGLVAAAIVGLCMLPFLHIAGHRRIDFFVPTILLIGSVLAGCLLALLLGDQTVKLLERLPGRLKLIAVIFHEVVSALRAYADRWLLMLGLLFLSVLAFTMLLAAIMLLGVAMQFEALSLPGYFTAGVWATIANAVPLTPGGLGIGEAAFAQVAHMLEAVPSHASYATAFLAMRVINALISALGLVPYVANRRQVLSAVQSANNGAGSS